MFDNDIFYKFLQIKSLLGTKVEWLYYILQAFNSGDLVRYQELCHVHNAALRAQPALVENEKKLLEKINILCLMEIIFRFSIFFLNVWSRGDECFLIQFVIIFIVLNWYMLPCSRPSEDRTIPLSIIAERTKLSIEDVEHLLMKSLSVSPCVLEILVKSNWSLNSLWIFITFIKFSAHVSCLFSSFVYLL